MDSDSQFAILKQIIVEELANGVKAPEIAEYILSRDEIFHPNEPYLKSSRFSGQSPLAAANMIVLREMAKTSADDEYVKYRDFFNDLLRGAKKDIVSGWFQAQLEDGSWQFVDNRLEAIKSYANGHGLKPSRVTMHYARYVEDQPKRLLMPIIVWDGVDRIEQLKDFIKFKTQDPSIFIDALKEWGGNIFARLYKNNAQNRCIILKGGQGIGKDHLLNSIFSAFDPYYAKFSSNKDQRECWDQVTSSLVLHIEEFDQTGSLSIPFLKDLITRDRVTYRSPYARSQVTRKCVGSFISTVNIDAILRDETGNRRFAVFEIESIDWSYPKDWGQQIAAQFYELYREGYRARPETWTTITVGNEQFEQVDMTPELLDLWDKRVAAISKAKRITELSFSDVVGIIDDIGKSSGLKARGVCTMLKTHGRTKKRKHGHIYFSKTWCLQLVTDKPMVTDGDRNNLEHRSPDKYANIFDDL